MIRPKLLSRRQYRDVACNVSTEASQVTIEQTMQFAGCWEDMSDKMFADFNEEVITRRQQAFLVRRSHESSII
ncbi:hypothetical protein DP116_09865 [Brasilonema bromeliae SPC951]|uniref:Uncharacterized protein n=1 Tax=Brasilonema bromeliae SPC951 TaxID=385972 RepID=A0ABX1P6T8_9CYAN|nr:hypothetical protein [Brasilonema bromeliae SPC951]